MFNCVSIVRNMNSNFIDKKNGYVNGFFSCQRNVKVFYMENCNFFFLTGK